MTSFIDAIRIGQYNKWRKEMKVYIWIHKNDIISGKISKHSYTRPYQDRNEEWVQVSVSVDEFARLEDKDKGDTYPEFVEKHYKSTPDVVKQYQNTKGGDFPKWWDSLSIEQKSTIQKEYGWNY